MALWLLALPALVLILAQVLLPRIAASRISSRVGRYGTVESVTVSAWPAVKVLWGSADTVRLRAGMLVLTPERTARLLSEAASTRSLDVTAADVREGPLHLTEVRLSKRGSELEGEGRISDRDVAAALPPGVRVQLLASEGGRVLVRVSGGLFGLHAGVDAVAQASGGSLVAHPLHGTLENLRLTLFSDPRIEVQGVAASAQPGPAGGYLLRMSARLR